MFQLTLPAAISQIDGRLYVCIRTVRIKLGTMLRVTEKE